MHHNSQKVEFYLIFLLFFHSLHHFSPLLCLLSLSLVPGRVRIVFFVSPEGGGWRYGILITLLHRISTVNFLFYHLSTCLLWEVPCTPISCISLVFTDTKQSLLDFHIASLDFSFLSSVKTVTTCLLAVRCSC